MDTSLLDQPGALAGLIGGLIGGLVGLGGGVFGTYCSWRAAQGPRERTWILRYAALILIAVAIFLALMFSLHHRLARTVLFSIWPIVLVIASLFMQKHLSHLRATERSDRGSIDDRKES